MADNERGFALHLTAATPGVGDDARPAERHFLQTHDASGTPLLVRQVMGDGERPALEMPAWGFDDVRLFWWKHVWRCLASRPRTAPEASGKMFLVDLGSDGSGSTTVDASPLGFGGIDRDAMPVVVHGRLFVVTRLDPFDIVGWDRTRGRFEFVSRTVSAPGLSGWIGGSSGLRIADGFLFVIRRVRLGDRFKIATHRFLAVDDRLCPVAASREFVFQRYGTEACLGLARWRHDLLCAYACGQGRGFVSSVGYDAVRANLQPLT